MARACVARRRPRAHVSAHLTPWPCAPPGHANAYTRSVCTAPLPREGGGAASVRQRGLLPSATPPPPPRAVASRPKCTTASGPSVLRVRQALGLEWRPGWRTAGEDDVPPEGATAASSAVKLYAVSEKVLEVLVAPSVRITMVCGMLEFVAALPAKVRTNCARKAYGARRTSWSRRCCTT